MEDKVVQIEQRIAEIEKRIAKLEGFPGTKPTVILSKEVPLEKKAAGPEQTSAGISILGIALLVIGGLILLSSLPSFLYGLFGGSSYGYSFTTNLIWTVIGSFLVAFGLRQIQRHREVQKREPQIQKDTASQIVFKSTPSTEKTTKEEEQSFEFKLAANWFAIVGIVAIVLAVVFFLKFAFDNGLIGPIGQVIIGLVFGICLIFAGEALREKVHKYSQIISSGGIVVLYLSIWAAYGLFYLISPYVALSSMSLITILSSLLAIRYEAVYIGVLGVIGGFATPILLGKGFESEMILMSYIIILNLGVLAVSFFKNWRELNIATFASTYIVFVSWVGIHWKVEKFLETITFLTIIFLIFAVSLFIYNFVYKKEAGESDIILMLLNAVVYFGLGYYLMTDAGYKDFIGFFAFCLSAFYFVLGSLSYQKFKETSYLTLGFLGISIFFLTIAVPLSVKKNLITIVWAMEAASLLLLGFLISSQKLRVAACIIYILVVIRLVGLDTQIDISKFTLIFNMRFLTFMISVISMGIASYLYFKYRQNLDEDEKKILPSLLIVANILLIWALSWESISYFARRIDEVKKADLKVSTSDVRVLSQRIAQTQFFPATDSAKAQFGIVEFKIQELNAQGTNPFTTYIPLATVKLTDVTGNRVISQSFSNADGLAAFGEIPPGRYGILAYKAGYKGIWKQNGYGSGSGCIQSGLKGTTFRATIQNQNTGGLIAAWDDGLEIDGGATVLCRDLGLTKISSQEENPPYNYGNTNYRQSQSSNYQPPKQLSTNTLKQIKNLESARDISISIIWLFYSVMLLGVGIGAKYKPIRLFALAFLMLTIFKVFVYDSRNLQQGYRIVAFMVLGTILLATSLVYQRYKTQISAFLLNDK